MGIKTAITFAICWLVKAIFGAAAQKDSFLYKIKYLIAYGFVRCYKKRQLPTFSFDKFSSDLGKLGITSLPEAWMKERPRKLSEDAHALDSIAIWGGDCQGNLLIASLSRRHGRISEVLIYLRLSTGEEFQLPAQPDLYIYNTSGCSFSAAGLTFEIHEPLRRCRITFNGLLRKGIHDVWDEDYSNVVNARFTFTWHPFSFYYAFNDDFPVGMMAACMAQADWRATESLETLIRAPVEMYEQWGHLDGFLHLEGREETKMLLRGSKERKFGISNWSSVQEKFSIKGSATDGNTLHLEVTNASTHLKNVIVGCISPPCNTKLCPISDMDKSVEDLFSSKNESDKFNLTVSSGNQQFKILASLDKGFKIYGGNNWDCEVFVRPIKFSLNGRDGYGFLECGRPFLGKRPFHRPCSLPLVKEPDEFVFNNDPVVTLHNSGACQSRRIVGGKGASLAIMAMMPKPENSFVIPNGICLTKYAFEKHVSQNKIIERSLTHLENVAWKKIDGHLEQTCKSIVEVISESAVSDELKDNIKKHLQLLWDQYENMKFAIRSSGIGEDGEELSAAGQNDTFLGVTGLDQICHAAVKCWASQFSFRSVEYKRRNGQLINDGMGVVIQEMVPADIAGVLFTRHPITGNLGSIVITANYGLGESVVSASVDPDTIILKRKWDDHLSIQEIQIGNKKNKVVMTDNGGTEEMENSTEVSTKCCISEQDSLRLGEIAVLLEKTFGSARDIEWAFLGKLLYLLQSRPVTAGSIITDNEIYHEFDSGMRTDYERYTTANIGEVMPGSNTPLSMTCDRRVHSICFARGWMSTLSHPRYDPSLLQGLSFFYNHIFFDQVMQKAWSLMDKNKSSSTKGFELGYYGRVLDDDDVVDIALERYEKPGFIGKIFGKAFANLMPIMLMFQGIRFLKTAPEKFSNLPVYAAEAKTAVEAYRIIEKRFMWVEDILINHIRVTFGSNFCNLIVLSILSADSEDFSLDHYNDFALLVGSCNGAESGDVPFNLKQLAISISENIDMEKFSSMSPEDALIWVSHTPTPAKKKYEEFLRRHGHRGMKEFEMRSPSWGMQPTNLIIILQKMLAQLPTIQKTDSVNVPFEETHAKLKTKLTFIKRKMMPYALSWSKAGVCYREKAKALLIKVEDCLRQSYHRLGKLMVNEGFLPDMDFIFFLTHEEIGQILQTRSPGLIARAERRRRAHPYMENIHFSEMVKGYPIPREELMRESIPADNAVVVLKAYPVCQGYVKGVARVVTSFACVNEIQEGDILITYATDIGWSPYFPMLGGVVTEIGGLVSHGAVVAREYGLPCLVAAENATLLFKSGDIVILDANKGLIQKIES